MWLCEGRVRCCGGRRGRGSSSASLLGALRGFQRVVLGVEPVPAATAGPRRLVEVPVGPPSVAVLGVGARLDADGLCSRMGQRASMTQAAWDSVMEIVDHFCPEASPAPGRLFVFAEPNQLSEGFDVLAEGGFGAGGVAVR